MEGIMASLTDEQQSLVWAVGIAGIAAQRARFAGIVRVNFNCQATSTHSLIGDVAVQFSKGPLGGMPVSSPLLLTHLFAMLAIRAFADMGQIFQTDETMRVRLYNAPTDQMVTILFQPSLSSTNHDEASCGGPSAFLLQPLHESRIVIGFGSYSLARIERCSMPRGSRDRQVTLSNIHPDNAALCFGCRISNLKFQGDEQVKLLAWLVIPEFSRSDRRAMMQECDMLVIASIGNNHAPIQGQDAHLVVFLQAVVPVIVVGQRRRDILGWFIQSLVAFLGDACLLCSIVLLHLCPERLIGGSHLARNIARHLRRQAKLQANIIVAGFLQAALIAHLAMRKTVLTHKVQRIAVRQLCASQGGELCRVSLQFQLGRDYLFHNTCLADIHINVKHIYCVNIGGIPPNRLKATGLLPQFVEEII